MPELDAKHLVSTLRLLSWAKVGEIPSLLEYWEDDRTGAEVVVPLDPRKSDFRRLLDAAAREVVRVDGDVARTVLREVELREQVGLESTFWRKETATARGLIGWTEGQRLVSSVNSSFQAAAKSAGDSRRYHGNAGSGVAKRFLEKIYMGQTQIGSFIVTAYVPGAVELGPTSLTRRDGTTDVVNISTDQVLDKLQAALVAAKSAAEEFSSRPNLHVFDGVETEGVSHEFAKALGQFVEGGESSVQIERSESPFGGGGPLEVSFEPPEAAVFEKMANHLAQTSESRHVDLIGEVTLLQREGRDDHPSSVHVVGLDVDPMSGERLAKKVKMRLSPSQYDTALQGHTDRRRVRVAGRLEREGPHYWLYDVTDISLGAPPTRLEDPFDFGDWDPDM